MQLTVAIGFLLGISGSYHGIGMCGPLVLAMPFQNESGLKKWASVLVYMLSKSMGYAILGVGIGLAGIGVKWILMQRYVSILTGVLLIIGVLLPGIFRKYQTGIKLGKMQNYFSKWMSKPGIFKFALLGILNAFLPCGLVYTALGVALVSKNMLSATLIMFTFGMGTAVLLSVLIFSKNFISMETRIKLNRYAKYVTLLIGVILIFRGLGLGIHYLSPSFDPMDPSCE